MSIPLMFQDVKYTKLEQNNINRRVETYPNDRHAILIMNTGLITCFKDYVHLRNKL